MFQVVYIDEILFAGDMNELRKNWSWIMSLYVSLFRGLSASKSPTPCFHPSLNRLTQTMLAHPVVQTQVSSNLLGDQSPCVHVLKGIFCFVLKPSLPPAPSIWLVGGYFQGLALISRSRCNLKTGLEGCESSVTNC